MPAGPSSLAEALGRRLGDDIAGGTVGLEHEYRLTMGGQRLDFRELIHDIAIAGQRLDPGDLNAYRCESGLVMTCDGKDAEVAFPPVPVRPGFTASLDAWVALGRAEVFRLLPQDVEMAGFSTHLSASVPEGMGDDVCALFARTFAPVLMLMLDHSDSHGVFVRPRPGRVELCGAYATDDRVRAAAIIVAGGVRACASAIASGVASAGSVPPRLAVDIQPASGRYGLFVGRDTFGFDLYAEGRHAMLPSADGGEIEAQSFIEQAWQAALSALGGDVNDSDVEAGSRMISGTRPLGVERTTPDEELPNSVGPSVSSVFGEILTLRPRPNIGVQAVAATWDFTIFLFSRDDREAYACVPRTSLDPFLDRLGDGALDPVVGTFLDSPPVGDVLIANPLTAVARLWDYVVIGPDLVPQERRITDGVPAVPPADGSSSTRSTYVRPGKAEPYVSPTVQGPETEPVDDSGAHPAGRTDPGLPVSTSTGGVAASSQPSLLDADADSESSKERSRTKALILVLVVGAVAVMAAISAGWFSDSDPTALTIVTSPSRSPSSLPTSGANVITTTTATSVALPGATPTTTPDEILGPEPTDTTVPVEIASAEGTTTTASTTTTEPGLTPTQSLVAISDGVLGCTFQPSSLIVGSGSTLRFRNDIVDGVSVSIAGPDGTTNIELDLGNVSAPYPLDSAGDYTATCSTGGDSDPGHMPITVAQ